MDPASLIDSGGSTIPMIPIDRAGRRGYGGRLISPITPKADRQLPPRRHRPPNRLEIVALTRRRGEHVVEVGDRLWASYRSHDSRAAAFAGGMLAVAALGAFLIGVVLLPFSLIALAFAGLGLLGFVPFLTAWRFLERSRRLFKGSAGPHPLPAAAGMIAALLPALLVFAAERVGDGIRHADLTSGDPQRVLRVLHRTRIYGIRDIAPESYLYGFGAATPLQFEVCQSLDRIPEGNQEIGRALRQLIRADSRSPEDACALLLSD